MREGEERWKEPALNREFKGERERERLEGKTFGLSHKLYQPFLFIFCVRFFHSKYNYRLDSIEWMKERERVNWSSLTGCSLGFVRLIPFQKRRRPHLSSTTGREKREEWRENISSERLEWTEEMRREREREREPQQGESLLSHWVHMSIWFDPLQNLHTL